MREKKEKGMGMKVLIGVFLILFSLTFIFADPIGPDAFTSNWNETKVASTNGQFINISGGVISSFNLTATVQNPRWKAFVGQVIGTFTLDDATGATIYDWTLASVTGRIYATRASGVITWTNVVCASETQMESENDELHISNNYDNITATFNGTTHNLFYVGAKQISADTCPTLNTYVGNSSQDVSFEEMAMSDTINMIYATIMEENVVGFDSETYDFQMIVPENGTAGYSGATPYYLYIELGN